MDVHRDGESLGSALGEIKGDPDGLLEAKLGHADEPSMVNHREQSSGSRTVTSMVNHWEQRLGAQTVTSMANQREQSSGAQKGDNECESLGAALG